MEKVTDPTRIYGLLKRLLEQKALLTVTVQDNEYISALIQIPDDRQTLMLDELKPREGHGRLLQTRHCHVHGQLEGIHISFEAPLEEVGDQDGLPYYVLRFPGSLNYFQRRAGVRTVASAAKPLPAQLTSDATGLAIEGEIKDVSVGGLGLRFNKPLPASLEAGAVLRCAFHLPNDPKHKFVCDVEIRIIRHRVEPHLPAFIGCRFVDLLPTQQRQIEKLVMTLQRQLQQRKSEM